MFGLFKSEEQKLIARANKFFKHYIALIKKCTPEELAAILDEAVLIRDGSSTLNQAHGADEQARLIYCNPSKVSRDVALRHLAIFNEKLTGWVLGSLQESRAIEGPGAYKNSEAREVVFRKRNGLAVWYFSLLAGALPEHRVKGDELWQLLLSASDQAHGFRIDEDVPPEFRDLKT